MKHFFRLFFSENDTGSKLNRKTEQAKVSAAVIVYPFLSVEHRQTKHRARCEKRWIHILTELVKVLSGGVIL